ncbi:MAG: hypothetical protein KF764_02395 [Labilithrix sp.]|nr:hypothetical protein [Labilithrix sp.]MBX3220754.1 hypothetical protein [Labilithrix sp.]
MRLRCGLASALSAALAASLAGCSLLFGPSDDVWRGETSAEVDAAPVIAETDGGVDASTDGPSGNSAPPFTCPADALLCDDFERDDVLGSFERMGGNVTITTAQAHSGTRSLSAVLKRDVESPFLEKNLRPPPRITLSLWFYAASAPTPDYTIRLAHLLWGRACDWDFTWQLSLTRGGLRADVGTYDDDTNPGCGPVDFDSVTVLDAAATFVPKWHHVVVTNDVSVRPRRATIQVDDGPVSVLEMTSRRTRSPSSLGVAVGAPCVQTTGGCFGWDHADYGVFIDDVSIVPTP